MEELHPFSTIMITFLIESEASRSGVDMSGEGLQALKMIQEASIEKFGGKIINTNRPGCQIVIFTNTFDAIDCSKEIEARNTEHNNLLVVYLTFGELDGSGTYLKDPGITDRVIAQISRPGIFVSKDILNTIQNNRSRLNSSNGIASESQEAQTLNQSKSNNSFIHRLEQAVSQNLSRAEYSVEDLASDMAMSRSNLHRKLQTYHGQSISQFIRQKRLEKAFDLLQEDLLTVAEIAYQVGFASPSYFNTCFHEHFGYPPGELRRVKEEQIESRANNVIADTAIRNSENDFFELYESDKQNPPKRQLAAILFSDIVGFSAIMNQDEREGLAMIETNRRIHQSLLAKSKGHWVKEMGDGIIAYFDSAIDAINFALELQHSVKMEASFQLRLGLHLGDIILQDGDVFGEGVNIASRVLSYGTGNSILITESLFREVENKPGIHTLQLGSYNLKNISRPVVLYAIANQGLDVPQKEHTQSTRIEDYSRSISPVSYTLIQEVFEELAAQKPSLEKFLFVDEEDEEVDIRLLAYQMIKNFPWPIGVELRRLFSSANRDNEPERVRQLQRVIDRNIKFVSYLCLTELSEHLYRDSTLATKDEYEKIKSELNDYSTHSALNLITIATDIFKRNKLSYFIKEIPEYLSKQAEVLNDYVKSTAKKQLENKDQLEKILKEQLKAIAFLVKYRMINVRTIQVNKRKYETALFVHSIDVLNSPNSEFTEKSESLPIFSDSNAVLLVKGIKNLQKTLNLSPFVIDTHSENGSNTGQIRRRDLFLLDKITDEEIIYRGCEMTEAVSAEEIIRDVQKVQSEVDHLINRNTN